jgi:hypothetical protein
MIRLLTRAKVRVITCASHTTHNFQILDLVPFGVLERRPSYALAFENDNATLNVMIKVYRDFKRTTIAPNIYGAFHALGLDFDIRREPFLLLFDGKKLRESAGFRELWFVDFRLYQRSGRRRTARFGWINNLGQKGLTSVYLYFVHH